MPLQQATARLPVAADRLGRKLAVVGRLQHLPHETQLAGRSLADVTLFSQRGRRSKARLRPIGLAIRPPHLSERNGLDAEDEILGPVISVSQTAWSSRP